MNPDYAPLANGAIYQQMKDGDELTIGGWLTVNCVGPETVKNNGNQNMDSLNFVLIPGAASVWEIWNFIAAYSAEQNLTRDHVYNNRFGNIILLTDGETIEVCTNVDPADFNPYQPNCEVTAQ